MALNKKIGVISSPSSTGNQAITGVGFEPQIVLFWSVGHTAIGSTSHYFPHFGAMDADGNEWAICNFGYDGDAVANRISKNDKSFVRYSTTSLTDEAEYVSMDSDGFTINWTTHTNTGLIIYYMAIGGLTNANVGTFTGTTSIGNQDITTIGFEPDTLLIAGAAQTSFGSASNDALISIGFADSSVNQEGVGNICGNGSEDKDRYYSQSNIINRITTAGAIADQAALTSYLSNGFRLNWSDVPATGELWCYVALAGLESYVGHTTQKTGTTGTQGITGVGFEPEGLLTLGPASIATGSSVSAAFSFGASIGTGSSDQGVISTYDYNENDIAYRYNNSGYVYAFQATSLLCTADLDSFDSDGFTLNFDIVEASNARYIPFLAFKEKISWLSGFTKRIKLTTDSTKIDSDLTHFPASVVLSSTQGDTVFDELAYTDVDDDFTGTDDDLPNSDLWGDRVVDPDAITSSIDIQGNMLEFAMTKASGDVVSEWIESNYVFSGDFDFELDFSNFDATTSTYLWCSVDGDTVGLFNSSANKYWHSTINGSNSQPIRVGTYGKLRMTRVGTTITTYGKAEGATSWYQIQTGTGSTDDSTLTLRSYHDGNNTSDYFNVDNFIVNSGTIIWPVGTHPRNKKIAFTTNDGETQLYGDIENWDDINEKAVIHVSGADWEILSSENTDFYMYYDSTQEDNTTYISDSGGIAAQSVYDSDVVMNQNMADDTISTILDSTSNNHDGAKTSADNPIEIDALIGKGQDFIDDEIVIPDHADFDLTGNFTIEAVVNIDDLTSARAILSKWWDGSTRAWHFSAESSGIFNFSIRQSGDGSDTSFQSAAGTAVTGSWIYVCARNDGTDYQMFIAGIASGVSVTAKAMDTNNADVNIGDYSHTSAHSYFDGIIQVTKVTNTDLSNAWIKARNYALTDDLLTYGTEESPAQVSTPIIDPTSGEYLASQLITITCGTSGSTIYYTEDGSTPDNTDTEYTAPFTLSAAKTIKAIAIKDGFYDSEIVSETYTIGTGVSEQPIIFIIIT